MSSEIFREPVAQALPQGSTVHEATDDIAAIIDRAPRPKKKHPTYTAPPMKNPNPASRESDPDSLSLDQAAAAITDIAEDGAQTAPTVAANRNHGSDGSDQPQGDHIDHQAQPPDSQQFRQVHQARQQLLEDAAAYENAARGIDWEGLRQARPAEYAALKADFADTRAALQSREQQIAGIEQEIGHGLQQHQQEQMTKAASVQYAACIKTIPGWKEPAKRQQDTEDMTKYLLDNGFPRERVAALRAMPDPDLVGLVYKAMMHDRSEKPEPAARRVRLKSNRKPSQPAWRTAANKEMKESNMRNPHSVEAAATRIKHMLGR